MWCGSTSHSLVEDAPSPGTRKKLIGPRYSMPIAAAHHSSRACGSASPPMIQQAPDTDSQSRMRTKFMPRGVRGPKARIT